MKRVSVTSVSVHYGKQLVGRDAMQTRMGSPMAPSANSR